MPLSALRTYAKYATLNIEQHKGAHYADPTNQEF